MLHRLCPTMMIHRKILDANTQDIKHYHLLKYDFMTSLIRLILLLYPNAALVLIIDKPNTDYLFCSK